MLDIKQEIKILLLKNGGISMRKLISQMQNDGYKDIPKSSTMSVQLNKERIRFKTVQDIIDYLGYELVIKEKQK